MHIGGKDQQLAILRPALKRFGEHRQGRGHVVELGQRSEQGDGRQGRFSSEGGEAMAQQGQRLGRFLQRSGGVEIGSGRSLVLVVQTSGETVKLERLRELSFRPQDIRHDEQGRAVGLAHTDGASQPMQGRLVLARVRQQFLGKLLPEDGVRLRPGANRGQQGKPFLAPTQFAKTAKLDELQVRVAGKLGQRFIDARRQGQCVRVVRRQRTPRRQRQPVGRRHRPHLLQDRFGIVTVILLEGTLQGVELIVERSVGQFQPVEKLLARPGNHDHATRSPGPIPFEEWLGDEFRRVIDERIPNQERAAQFIEPDGGLKMASDRLGSGERERDAAFQQPHGRRPGDRELARQEPILLGPSPLAVGGGAVVADRLGHAEMLGGHFPIATQGRQRGRGAR